MTALYNEAWRSPLIGRLHIWVVSFTVSAFADIMSAKALTGVLIMRVFFRMIYSYGLHPWEAKFSENGRRSH
jgi:hypothetical protein